MTGILSIGKFFIWLFAKNEINKCFPVATQNIVTSWINKMIVVVLEYYQGILLSYSICRKKLIIKG